jgi:hypothetical protein
MPSEQFQQFDPVLRGHNKNKERKVRQITIVNSLLKFIGACSN